VNFFAAFRRAAAFVHKILKGAKPTDIPIEQAARFDFVLNVKPAKALWPRRAANHAHARRRGDRVNQLVRLVCCGA
jgi:hypothetical protein